MVCSSQLLVVLMTNLFRRTNSYRGWRTCTDNGVFIALCPTRIQGPQKQRAYRIQRANSSKLILECLHLETSSAATDRNSSRNKAVGSRDIIALSVMRRGEESQLNMHLSLSRTSS